VSFGVMPKLSEPFTATTKVRLVNRGASPTTLTVKPPPVPGGVTLTVVPETLTIGAGASGELEATVSVAALTKPFEEKVALSGLIEVTGANGSIHVPWMVVNGDVLAVTYPGTEEFVPFISHSPIWPEGPRSFGGFALQTLAADVLVLSKTESDEPRLIIRERVRVNGYTPLTILPEEAALTLRIAATDERGTPLQDVVPDGTHAVWHTMRLPSLANIRFNYPERQRSMRVAPLTANTLIRTYEKVLGQTDHYFGTYRGLSGITEDTTLALGPQDWASQKLRFHLKPNDEVYVGAGGGSPQLWEYHLMPQGTSLWTTHITPRTVEDIDFRMHVMVREKGFVPFLPLSADPWVYMSSALRFREGRVAASTFNRSTAGDYFSPSRDVPLEIGDGPVTLRTIVGPRSLEMFAYGPLGEGVGEGMRSLQTKLENLDGASSLKAVSQYAGQYDLFGGTAGKYRLTATQPYMVRGRSGMVTVTSLFDTNVFPAPPSLSMLRVEDSRGTVTSIVATGTEPRLVFAARTNSFDHTNTFNVYLHPIDNAKTRVWWRPHGTTAWNELPVTLTGSDYEWDGRPGSPGSIFTTPLGVATAAEGEVDLKILVVNEYGFTTETVYEPAFIVGSVPGKRRAVRR
jgi:hypothetical protein